MTPTEQAQRKAISRIAVIWDKPTVPPRLLEEYVLALKDIDPDVLNAAITEANRTRTIRPSAAQIREIAFTIAPGRARVDALPTTEGVGCVYQAAGCRHEWIQASEMLISCRLHSVAWVGRLQTPPHDAQEATRDDERGQNE